MNLQIQSEDVISLPDMLVVVSVLEQEVNFSDLTITQLFLPVAKLVVNFIKDPSVSTFLNCYIISFEIS